MGKVVIIKNADFSANAIEQIVPHDYIQFVRGNDSSNNYRAVYNNVIPVGKKIGFVDSSMWTKYKMAIGIGESIWPDASTWDTQYSGSNYITNNVTILTQATQIMIAPIDGSSLTEDQLAEINDNTFFDD